MASRQLISSNCYSNKSLKILSTKLQIILSIIQIYHILVVTEAQVVFHELRRLAAPINQFGMDTLKALDRIEPPDKVIVFCPACLSSSLMMIMMGSNKYPVVSTLRHALYVWPMKPVEINRGYRDIFDYIGMNQHLQRQTSQIASSRTTDLLGTRSHLTLNGNGRSNPEYQNVTINDGRSSDTSSLVSWNSNNSMHTKRSLRPQSIPEIKYYDDDYDDTGDKYGDTEEGTSNNDQFQSGSLLARQRISLPRLMRLRERPWWHSSRASVKRRRDNYSVDNLEPIENRETKADTISQMSALSNVYIQRGLSMNFNYHLLLRQYYKTVIHPVDFMQNSEETRQHVNSLVAASTGGKIKDLVKKEVFDSSRAPSMPKIMIISTFHFRGTLDVELRNTSSDSIGKIPQLNSDNMNSETSTRKSRRREARQRRSEKSKQLFIETEPTLLKYGHLPAFDCSVIEIPFNNRLVSLIIVVSDHSNGTDLLLARMNAKILNDLVSSLVVKKISLEIPVIKFDRGPINMTGLMKELQLDDIFFGNKTYSTETGLNRWMKSSDIVHETSIDIGTVNPYWAEAGIKIDANEQRRSKRQQPKGDHLKLDRPFLYFVMDSINGLILTMGRIRI